MKKNNTINFMPFTLLAAVIGMNMKYLSYKLQIVVGIILIILALWSFISNKKYKKPYLEYLAPLILLLFALDIIISSLIVNIYIKYDYLLFTNYYKAFEILLIIVLIIYLIVYYIKNVEKDEYVYIFKALKTIISILALGFLIIIILYFLKVSNFI